MMDLTGGLPDSPACPLLGLVADPATHFSFPHAGHRCGATRSPSAIDLPHQSRYCLSADFEGCERYAAQLNKQAARAKPQLTPAAAASTSAPLPTAASPEATAPSATTAVVAVSTATPADSPVTPAGQTSSTPATLASRVLYPPDQAVPGPVRARAPGTWRQTSIEADAGGPAASSPAVRPSRAVRIFRGVALAVVLLLALFVAAYLVAGSKLGLSGAAGQPTASAAAVGAPAATTGQGASPAPSVAGAGASSTPAQSAGASSSPRPTPSESPAPTRSPLTKSTIHIVRSGETLQSIAAEYGITVEQIVAANKLQNANVIVTGQRLVIPVPSRAP